MYLQPHPVGTHAPNKYCPKKHKTTPVSNTLALFKKHSVYSVSMKSTWLQTNELFTGSSALQCTQQNQMLTVNRIVSL